jgi:hypothetical protein
MIPLFAYLLSTDKLLTISRMSQAPSTTASSSSSNFQSIFKTALEDYKKKTKCDLLKHGLTAQLECCDSANAILDVLYGQPHVRQFIQSRTDSGISSALGQGVSMVDFQRSSHRRSAL